MTDRSPTPWVFRVDDYGQEWWFGGDGQGQIVISDSDGFEVAVYMGFDEEDARLIVAAPELLAAAAEVMEALGEHGGSIVPHLIDTDDNPGERLRQAIAKACGEETR